MPPSITARSPDFVVVGGGIVGLWTAFEAARQGLSVTLLEKRTIGAGASGGLLGALMPHQPTGWTDKKQFQLDGLLSLETEIAELEALTGISTGYQRCGRIMPIRNAEKRRQSGDWAQASQERWPPPFRWDVSDETPDATWLPPAEMPFGINADTLSARVSPRGLLSALRQAAELSGVTIREGVAVEQIEADGKLATTDDEIAAGHVVLAAGWQTFGLIEHLHAAPCGTGVKGQAALLRPAIPVDPALPILYDNGTYVIAHADGHVAIGSTSENMFGDPLTTDERLEAVIKHATSLCPALKDAEVIERWAGVRPKAAGREPLVGPLPGVSGVSVATGGFKISFAIAHLMAKAVVSLSRGETPDTLPQAFLPENRVRPLPC